MTELTLPRESGDCTRGVASLPLGNESTEDVFIVHGTGIPGQSLVYLTECDVPVPRIPGTGNFSFFWWYRNRYRKKLVPEKSLGTGIGKIWYRKKVSEPVSEKFSTGKKSRNRYRKNLVPEKSLGTGIKYIWYRKKFSANFAILLSLSQ